METSKAWAVKQFFVQWQASKLGLLNNSCRHTAGFAMLMERMMDGNQCAPMQCKLIDTANLSTSLCDDIRISSVNVGPNNE
jgi:hypothetical protein